MAASTRCSDRHIGRGAAPARQRCTAPYIIPVMLCSTTGIVTSRGGGDNGAQGKSDGDGGGDGARRTSGDGHDDDGAQGTSDGGGGGDGARGTSDGDGDGEGAGKQMMEMVIV